MTTKTWRLLDTGARSGAANMALDEVLLAERSRGAAPNTLRFLQFAPHCALIGYHQDVEQELRLEYCRAHGIEINRRLTGGGALYWDESQLGWEVYVDRSDLPAVPDLVDLHRLFCEGTIRGLSRLGVDAAFRPRNDIEVTGRKISGTGGTAQGQTLLFQGSLLVDFDVDAMLQALRIPIEKLQDKEIASIKERVTSLATVLGQAPPVSTIKAALAAGFSDVLGIELQPGPLTAGELAAFTARLPYFQSDAWVYGEARPQYAWGSLQAVRRAPGGTMRVALLLEGRPPRIREVFLTGDFFAQPPRAIRDLEARLKGIAASAEAVAGAVQAFFADEHPAIPGIGPEDFTRLICQALAKLDEPTRDAGAGVHAG